MRESRSERIIARQRQCGTCQSERPGFCILKKKRFSDMDMWEDCQDYKRKERKVSITSFLYRLARKVNDLETITSGKPKKMVRRAKNKAVGRTVGHKLWKFPF